MFCSTVIASINRPTLTAAVQSVLDQDFRHDDFEVIVVNDLGQSLPVMEWQESGRVRVLVTQRRERSVARNTGAAVALGKYLHFLDDDDLMAPGALQAFWEVDQKTDAVWLHGRYQSMDDDRQTIATFSPFAEGDAFALLVAGEFVPLQASLLRTDTFFAAGAFDPSFHIVEDFDLGRRIGALGKLAKTSETVAYIRTGRAGSSGDWSKFAANWRRSYEKTLGQPGLLSRLEESAHTSSYWRGRIARHYLSSLAWNLRQRNFSCAAHRLFGLLTFSRCHPLSPAYWRGVRKLRA